MRGKKFLSIVMIATMILGLFTGTVLFKAEAVKADAIAGEATAMKGQKYSDIENSINNGTLQGISGTFQDPSGDDDNLTAVYKVTIPEDGYAYINFGEKGSENSMTMYVSHCIPMLI